MKIPFSVSVYEHAAALIGRSPWEVSRDGELMFQAHSAELGHPLPCIIGGDTEPIIEAIMETGTGFVICPAETNRERFLRRMEAHPEVKVRVNLDPRVYTRGTEAEIVAEVDRVIELAAGRPNIWLGTGAVPYETPPQNILLIRDHVT